MKEADSEPEARQILVVDDAVEIRLLARAALERRGFHVAEAEDGEAAVALVRAGNVDLMVLDVNLPRMSGLAVLSRLRQESVVPVILLTSLQEEADRVLGLEMGADDYVVKPFSPVELAARVASVLRRSNHVTAAATFGQERSHSALSDGAVVVHLSEHRVLVAGAVVDLTPKEFDLLVCLASAPLRAFSRAELLEQVWGSALEWQDPSTVTEHVHRLRRKIESDPDQPRWIQTVRGVGYRFDPGQADIFDGRLPPAPPASGPDPS